MSVVLISIKHLISKNLSTNFSTLNLDIFRKDLDNILLNVFFTREKIPFFFSVRNCLLPHGGETRTGGGGGGREGHHHHHQDDDDDDDDFDKTTENNDNEQCGKRRTTRKKEEEEV